MNLVETTAWLVDIPSPTGDEAAVCQAVAERLSHLPSIRVGNSLVVGERSGRPLLVLAGHLDTVPSQGQPPSRIEGGRLHGLGATDMKAGVAVMIHLLEEVVSSSHDVVGVFYEGEEGPADGNALGPILGSVEWLQQAEFGVVLEPCDGEIQIGCNGVINARIGFHGSSAHSARPWLGRNAITRAGEWLAAMDRLEPISHLVGGLEFREVMSVTRASGGIANNIIPDNFTLNLNYRFTPDLSREQAIARVQEVCAPADQVEVVDFAPAGPVEAEHPLVAALQKTSGAKLAPKQGWTDVARLGEFGIPAVNYGPGDTSLAHQVGESVEIADIERVYTALATILL